ncbi:hypothetical protein PR048_000884 [Dryococelus australis]|uniref:Uncharacterized protein n=1 Tax=Dryococelus australis TaxID=614101 RepID=A0ABQ9IFU4_9NEOP|nr:hypothetical protein PR048_000884 [Dryococelus australis]
MQHSVSPPPWRAAPGICLEDALAMVKYTVPPHSPAPAMLHQCPLHHEGHCEQAAGGGGGHGQGQKSTFPPVPILLGDHLPLASEVPSWTCPPGDSYCGKKWAVVGIGPAGPHPLRDNRTPSPLHNINIIPLLEQVTAIHEGLLYIPASIDGRPREA